MHQCVINHSLLKAKMYQACQEYLAINFRFSFSHGDSGKQRAKKVFEFLQIADGLGLIVLVHALLVFNSSIFTPTLQKKIIDYLVENKDTIFARQRLGTNVAAELRVIKILIEAEWQQLIAKAGLPAEVNKQTVNIVQDCILILAHNLDGKDLIYLTDNPYISSVKNNTRPICSEILLSLGENPGFLYSQDPKAKKLVNDIRALAKDIKSRPKDTRSPPRAQNPFVPYRDLDFIGRGE